MLNEISAFFKFWGGRPDLCQFLASMSSSRSDVVTQCVHVSVFSCVRVFIPFFSLVSLKFPLILKGFNVVSRQFKWCLKFIGSFKDVSSFKGVSWKFQGCFKEV